MDKEIIYIDPSDDITDIISKIKEAKNKTIALVPPKKATVLQSSVNFKLIAKTAQTNDKDISLITTSDSLKHLAANAKIPVASNTKSAAAVPDLEEDFHKPSPSKVIEADEDAPQGEEEEEEVKSPAKKEEKPEKENKPKDLNSSRKSKEEKAKKPKKDSIVPNFNKYRKWIILGAALLLALIVFLIWALAFAPGVTVTAKVQTTSHNLTKNLEFTTKNEEVNVKGGVLLAKEETHTEKSEIEFNATGEKDNGKKASGTLILKRTSPVKARVSGNKAVADPITISAGTRFSYNGLAYIAKESATLKEVTWDNPSACPGPNTFDTYTCNLTKDSTASIAVEAEAAGEKYNGPGASGWSAGKGWIVSDASVGGGSTEIVKIVTDQDIKNAEASATTGESADKIKEELTDKFGSSYYILENSFSGSDKKSTSSIPVGQQVNGDTKPKLKVEVIYRMIAVSRKDLNDYVTEQVKQDQLIDNKTQKIYSTGINKRTSTKEDSEAIFFQSFEKVNDAKYTARLKTVVEIGPKVDETQIKEKIAGKKIGEAQAEIQSIEGLNDVKVKSNFVWVNSVPSDPERVKVDISSAEE